MQTLRAFLFVSITTLAISSTAAVVITSQPISISAGPEGMHLSVFQSQIQAQPHETMCAEAAEVPGAFLCMTGARQQMNEMFTRIGIYWGSGNGFPPGTIVPHSNSNLQSWNQMIAGHNLPGHVISNFLQAVQSAPADSQPNSAESEFFKGFVSAPKILALKNRYYLIAVSLQAGNFKGVLSHEIHHARYYLEPQLKKVIDEFWKNEVTEADKGEIRKTLGVVYNSENESLMIDEFQAYLLEKGSETGMLAKFVGAYKEKLTAQLRSKFNYTAIEIQ